MKDRTNHDYDPDPAGFEAVRARRRQNEKSKHMELGQNMPVQFGKVKATVFGGPFIKYIPGQRRLVGIKMAVEINHPHEFRVDTHDFDVPKMEDMHRGIAFALESILAGNDIYVGCMGGKGRTGLFMACLAKVMYDYSEVYEDDLDKDVHYAVQYVRSTYHSHAVETRGQQAFVAEFNTMNHVQYLKDELDRKVVEVPVYIFNPFLAILNFWTKRK